MERPPSYADEIRQYLLGRLSKHQQTGILPHLRELTLSRAPVLRWWIFEGKRYEGLDGCLAANWRRIANQTQHLLKTFSPRWRVLDVPEGRVDWLRTLNLHGGLPQYVCDTSHMGLSDEERQALLGWVWWISSEWSAYHQRFPKDEYNEGFTLFQRILPQDLQAQEPDAFHQRRWASIARRSRWPLLRNVVAETYRCLLEPQELDRLPLPEKHSTLFELLCLVRLLRALEPHPEEIRWLDAKASQNMVELPGLKCKYQQYFKKSNILSTDEFDGGLASAMELFGVRVPSEADVLLLFDKPRAGFDGILLEAKSGKQDYFDCLLQLKAYRATLPREAGQQYLIWGAVENPTGGRLQEDQLGGLEGSADNEDLWVFSGADDILKVMEIVGLSNQNTS